MTRSILDIAPHRFSIHIQHPAMRLTVVTESAAGCFAGIPSGPGCYVLLAVAQQTAYVGTASSLAGRIMRSRARNLPAATHVVLIEPLGVDWTAEQRIGLEQRLMNALPGARNWQRAAGLTPDTYLDAVTEQTRTMVGWWLVRPPTGQSHRGLPSQARIARDLVGDETRHPYTLGGLVDRLRVLGWSAQGETPWKTLRRDLRCASRGGTELVRVDGPWASPDTHVYIDDRSYTSGWRPHQSAPLCDRESQRGSST